jgi:16S rRNA processing protein RimM
MKVDSCFQLGYILKPHGLQGDVLVFLDTDKPEYYEGMESVFIKIENKLVPFLISELQLRKNRAIIRFEGVHSIEEAERLKGNSLYLPLEQLPPLEDDQFYYHDVINFMIIDESGQDIGKVHTIYEANGNDLFAVYLENREVLIPIQDDFIREIDYENQKIHMHLPKGLLEVYLNGKNK